MRRDRVDSSSEVKVMREIDSRGILEGLSNIKSQHELASIRMVLLISLIIFEDFHLFLPGSLFEILFLECFWVDGVFVVSRRDSTDSSSDGPDIFNNIEDIFIDFPFGLGQNV